MYMCVHKNEMYSDVSPLQRAPRNCFCWLFECHFNNSLPQIEACRLCAWILQLQLAAATSFASVCLPACLPAVAASMRQNALLPVNGQKHLPHLINCSIKLINICLCLGTGHGSKGNSVPLCRRHPLATMELQYVNSLWLQSALCAPCAMFAQASGTKCRLGRGLGECA